MPWWGPRRPLYNAVSVDYDRRERNLPRLVLSVRCSPSSPTVQSVLIMIDGNGILREMVFSVRCSPSSPIVQSVLIMIYGNGILSEMVVSVRCSSTTTSLRINALSNPYCLVSMKWSSNWTIRLTCMLVFASYSAQQPLSIWSPRSVSKSAVPIIKVSSTHHSQQSTIVKLSNHQRTKVLANRYTPMSPLFSFRSFQARAKASDFKAATYPSSAMTVFAFLGRLNFFCDCFALKKHDWECTRWEDKMKCQCGEVEELWCKHDGSCNARWCKC